MESQLEDILLNMHKEGMTAWFESHPEVFEDAMGLALSQRQPFAWRAAWMVWSCMQDDDNRIRPHIDAILDFLPQAGDGHQRELLKILRRMQTDEGQQGRLFDLCLTLWEKIHKKPSLRYHAFMALLDIARNYPDLLGEIRFLSREEYLETLSPGIRRAIEGLNI